jgi:Carbohydrate family 9 binding domain-like/NedA-like, galactose-binding domain
MKQVLSALIILSTLIVSGTDKLPTYESRKTVDNIVIDGQLREKSWINAPVIMLKNNKTGQLPVLSTATRICWNRNFLYIAFTCEDDVINARLKEHDADLYRENEVVEVFLNQDQDDSTYFEFQINPNNARFDAMVFLKENYLLKSFNPKSFHSAVKRTGSGWIAEMKISWEDIGKPGKPASAWCMNFYRLNKSRAKIEHSAWSPTGGNGHQPDKFGRVILAAERNGIKHYASTVWCGESDSVFALTDGKYPDAASKEKPPRFTWWPHKGSKEWVELKFNEPHKISEISLFWFDDSGQGGGCKIPQNAKISYLKNKTWHEVNLITAFSIEKNKLTTIQFTPVNADAIRLVVKLQSGFSGGLYEFKVK